MMFYTQIVTQFEQTSVGQMHPGDQLTLYMESSNPVVSVASTLAQFLGTANLYIPDNDQQLLAALKLRSMSYVWTPEKKHAGLILDLGPAGLGFSTVSGVIASYGDGLTKLTVSGDSVGYRVPGISYLKEAA